MTIKRRDFLKKAGAGAGLATLGACGGGEDTAEAVDGGVSGPRVEWRLATSYPPSVDILYGATDRLYLLSRDCGRCDSKGGNKSE